MKLPSAALSLAAHDASPLLAAGLVRGGVVLGSRDHARPLALPGATRALAFASPAARAPALYAANDAAALAHIDPAAHAVVATYDTARASGGGGGVGGDDVAALSALAVVAGGAVVAAGDDDGGVRLLDVRAKGAVGVEVAAVLEQGDYVTAVTPLAGGPDGRLAVASGDGSLCVYDARMPPRPRLRLLAAAPGFDDDLLSLTLVGGGVRAVGGCLSGAVNVYDMRFVDADEDEPDMARFVDRFYGHPESVSAVLAYGEDEVLLTGSSDGLVRVIDTTAKAVAGVLPFLPAEDGEESSDSESADGKDVDNDEESIDDADDHDNDDDIDAEDDDDDDDDDKDVDKDTISARKPADKKQHVPAATTAAAVTPARKHVSWPVEAMVIVRGGDTPLIAVIGHRACVRFCDASLLHDDGDDDADDDAARVLPPPEVLRPSKRRKGKKGAAVTTPAAAQSFFDGL